MKTAPFLAVSKNTRPMALCVGAVLMRVARCETLPQPILVYIVGARTWRAR